MRSSCRLEDCGIGKLSGARPHMPCHSEPAGEESRSFCITDHLTTARCHSVERAGNVWNTLPLCDDSSAETGRTPPRSPHPQPLSRCAAGRGRYPGTGWTRSRKPSPPAPLPVRGRGVCCPVASGHIRRHHASLRHTASLTAPLSRASGEGLGVRVLRGQLAPHQIPPPASRCAGEGSRWATRIPIAGITKSVLVQTPGSSSPSPGARERGWGEGR